MAAVGRSGNRAAGRTRCHFVKQAPQRKNRFGGEIRTCLMFTLSLRCLLAVQVKDEHFRIREFGSFPQLGPALAELRSALCESCADLGGGEPGRVPRALVQSDLPVGRSLRGFEE